METIPAQSQIPSFPSPDSSGSFIHVPFIVFLPFSKLAPQPELHIHLSSLWPQTPLLRLHLVTLQIPKVLSYEFPVYFFFMDNYGTFLETFLCLAYLHLWPSASVCGTLSFLVPIDLFCSNYSASLPHKWRLLPVLSLVFCPSVCLSSLHPMSLSIPSVVRTP